MNWYNSYCNWCIAHNEPCASIYDIEFTNVTLTAGDSGWAGCPEEDGLEVVDIPVERGIIL